MENINKKTLGIDHDGRAIMIRSQVLLLMLYILLICMKHIVLMFMINIFDNHDYDDDTDADTDNDTGDDTDDDINTHIIVWSIIDRESLPCT